MPRVCASLFCRPYRDIKLNPYLVRIEVAEFGAWVEIGPEAVFEEALKRLKTGGWKAVRPAIGMTIRYDTFLVSFFILFW